MHRNSRGLFASFIVLMAFGSVNGREVFPYTVVTERNKVSIAGRTALIDGGEATSVPGAPEIGYKVINLVLPSGTELTGISVRADKGSIIASGQQIDFAAGDIKTGNYPQNLAASPDPVIYGSNEICPQERARIISSGYWGSVHLATIAVYPLGYKPVSEEVIWFREIAIDFELGPSSIRRALISSDGADAYRFLRDQAANADDLVRAGILSASKPLPLLTSLPAPEYLVVTSASLAPAFEPFVEWKNQKGVPAHLVTMNEVLGTTQGIDPAEQLRNYLITAHESGVRWVLLGGDEDNVPIRYLFAGNVSGYEPPLSWMQVSDLYYADLTGNWDADGDHVWGEIDDDDPDIYPEIYVGRIPARSPEEVSIWVSKALEYEKNPGNGDPSYLTKALIISADEMRDLDQHRQASRRIPGNFTIDIDRLAEEPGGGSEFPTQPTGERVIEVMQEGWGFISNLNHGDLSYYASMSSGYNVDGRSDVWGDTVFFANDGAFSHMTNYHNPGVHYSISCDVAAFDFDKGVFYPGPWMSTHCLAESYLFQPGGGVAFLGYTRWGWVSSSFRLETKFLLRVFVDSTSQLGVAEALSKTDYPSYLDIVYGHNLFGDPEMALWLSVDGRLSVEGPSKVDQGMRQSLQFHVSDEQGPVGDASVCLYFRGQMLMITRTDNSGLAQFDVEPQSPGVMTVTATKQRRIPAQAPLVVEDQTGIADGALLPQRAFVRQNYPNPFNSGTAIEFGLPRQSQVSIDIYDIGGRRVTNLASGVFPAGANRVMWNGKADTGGDVASGIYFYRFACGQTVMVKQMTIVK